MKFLCVSCDEAMELTRSGPDEEGSLTALFECPACGNRTAMLTNPWETEVVNSLGVRVGAEGGTSCPFAASGSDAESEAPAGEGEKEGGTGLPWTAGALERLERIPEFVRPMARRGIEDWARSEGRQMVTESVLDAARGRISGL